MIYVSPVFFVTIVAGALLGGIEAVLCAFFTALLHEGGHALTALLLGYKIKRVSLLPLGVSMELTESFKSDGDEMLVASAGPLVNLVLLIVTLILGRFRLFAWCNVAMLLINTVPVTPLDGGRIVYLSLKNELGRYTGEAVYRWLYGLCILLLLFSGAVLLYRTKFNFSILFSAVFLWGADGYTFRPLICKEARRVRHYQVTENVPLRSLLSFTRGRRPVMLDIVDKRGFYMGSVTEKQVLEGIINHGYDAEIKNLIIN